jgi:hypothetical protein
VELNLTPEPSQKADVQEPEGPQMELSSHSKLLLGQDPNPVFQVKSIPQSAQRAQETESNATKQERGQQVDLKESTEPARAQTADIREQVKREQHMESPSHSSKLLPGQDQNTVVQVKSISQRAQETKSNATTHERGQQVDSKESHELLPGTLLANELGKHDPQQGSVVTFDLQQQDLQKLAISCRKEFKVFESHVARISNHFLWGDWHKGEYGVLLHSLDWLGDDTHKGLLRGLNDTTSSSHHLRASFVHASLRAPLPGFRQNSGFSSRTVGRDQVRAELGPETLSTEKRNCGLRALFSKGRSRTATCCRRP